MRDPRLGTCAFPKEDSQAGSPGVVAQGRHTSTESKWGASGRSQMLVNQRKSISGGAPGGLPKGVPPMLVPLKVPTTGFPKGG
jgi:hypothetical protein